MSLGTARLAVIGCVALASACVVVGCLGGDDTSTPGSNTDGGLSGDTGTHVLDASGHVDGQGNPNPTPDAGVDAPPDAPVVDAGFDAPLDAPGVDAGPDAGAVSVAGLVSGGTSSLSAHYALTATAGPATGIVARSQNFQLVGGMAVSTQTVK